MTGGPQWRVLRSAVFAGLAVALAAGLRQAVTGDAAPVPWVLAGFGVVFAVALLLSSGERRFASIAALLVPLELLLNALLNSGRHGCAPDLGDLVCGGAVPSAAGRASRAAPGPCCWCTSRPPSSSPDGCGAGRSPCSP